ncbi:MAG: sigma-54-dependent Fis family transcriptional regulator [Desulfofustis sp.]|nr:sigma-54-dependent Fis family transcriptional regulator [Desulfofustis sp.]
MQILIVDDEQMQREMLAGFLERRGYAVLTASGGREALALFEREPVQLVLIDHRMEDMNGDEVLRKMRERSPLVRAIMITAFASVETAVRVMQLGADDFLEKPVDLTELLEKIEKIEVDVSVQAEADELEEAVENRELPVALIGSSRAMKEVMSLVHRVAPTAWNVLVTGETGTGKELVARLIHLAGGHGDGPFIAVNCAAVPENLFEAELFGHEKGAFTDAASQRRGRFEQASGGTLFLDEISEVPLPMQAKLLRALQEKKISRLGGDVDINVNARVVTASNRDLKILIGEGRFREDLYYRLNVFELPIPPLRERREDIALLCEHFLEKHGSGGPRLAPEALAQLVKYDFPGNVRELEHLVQRLLTLTRGNLIRLKDLPPEIRERDSGGGLLSERLARVERDMLLAALQDHDGVQTRAAQALGISERVLRYKMKKAGIKGK